MLVYILITDAPVVQGIKHLSPKEKLQVRILAGAPDLYLLVQSMNQMTG